MYLNSVLVRSAMRISECRARGLLEWRAQVKRWNVHGMGENLPFPFTDWKLKNQNVHLPYSLTRCDSMFSSSYQVHASPHPFAFSHGNKLKVHWCMWSEMWKQTEERAILTQNECVLRRSKNCVRPKEVLLGLLGVHHALVIALCPPFLPPLPSFLFLLYFLWGLQKCSVGSETHAPFK